MHLHLQKNLRHCPPVAVGEPEREGAEQAAARLPQGGGREAQAEAQDTQGW